MSARIQTLGRHDMSESCVPSEFRDQADLALLHGLEWIRAAEEARNGSKEADAFTETVD